MFGKILSLRTLASLALTSVVGWSSPAPSAGPLLLADDSRVPRVRVSWTRADGSRADAEASIAYGSPGDRVVIADNLEAFVGLGGVRLEKGAGHAEGAIVRVGFFKVDRDRLFFADIANGSSVTIELQNVAFNQPAVPDGQTLLQRLEYKVEDVEACGLTIDQADMYNLASSTDDMGGMILPEQARFASLTGEAAGTGDARVSLEPDGTISLRVVLPYRLLRHKGDPWALEVPGTFFEPFHFDLEFEVLPEAVARAEGIPVVVRTPHE